jgi:hypothetical protein
LVVEAVEGQLRHQPDVPTRNRKRMHPNPVAPWELRIGDLRVFYDLEPAPADPEATDEAVVVILAVGIKKGSRLRLGDEECER